MKVNVCVCTYQRPSVDKALRSIDAQAVPDGVTFDIIVADNDEAPSARGVVEAFAATARHPVRYIHAASRNISIARNACLDAADGEWVAYIDDDEWAEEGWLSALLKAAQEGGHDAVFGPVLAMYPDDAPAWMKKSQIHSTFPRTSGGVVMTGHSGNCLMRPSAPALQGQRFLVDKGRTGGEDTEFFSRIRERGGRLGMAHDAIVHEALPAERISLAWLQRRWLRAGITRARHVEVAVDGLARYAAIAMHSAKVVACLGLALLTLPDPVRSNVWRVKAAYYTGMVQGAMNRTEDEHY